ncbi:MAG: 50S ribosomal protein L13 [Dysgonamonadaceae bacterium]|nr:50S ribosomal protein L13 [Dysgonamonadaceae bacterium]
MNTLSYKTISVNKETAKKEWVEIDATGQTLGRLSSKVAKLLRGKYKPSFTPHVDCGDNVIIVNADKVIMTGNKWTDRTYLRYSGYPGGQKESTPQDLMNKGGNKKGFHPLYRKVVKGMLPKNKLGDALLSNMFVYEGATHPHEAQKPKKLDINSLK